MVHAGITSLDRHNLSSKSSLFPHKLPDPNNRLDRRTRRNPQGRCLCQPIQGGQTESYLPGSRRPASIGISARAFPDEPVWRERQSIPVPDHCARSHWSRRRGIPGPGKRSALNFGIIATGRRVAGRPDIASSLARIQTPRLRSLVMARPTTLIRDHSKWFRLGDLESKRHRRLIRGPASSAVPSTLRPSPRFLTSYSSRQCSWSCRWIRRSDTPGRRA